MGLGLGLAYRRREAGRDLRLCGRSWSMIWLAETQSRWRESIKAPPIVSSEMRWKVSMTTPTKRLRTTKEPTMMKKTKKSAFCGAAFFSGGCPGRVASIPACMIGTQFSSVLTSTG